MHTDSSSTCSCEGEPDIQIEGTLEVVDGQLKYCDGDWWANCGVCGETIEIDLDK